MSRIINPEQRAAKNERARIRYANITQDERDIKNKKRIKENLSVEQLERKRSRERNENMSLDSIDRRRFLARTRPKLVQSEIARNLRRRQRYLLKSTNKNFRLSSKELWGCSITDLKNHLEMNFLPGMSWENYGINGWHIDHIRPCVSFDLTNIEEQKMCFHYTNLQPLWARDNKVKSSTWQGRNVRRVINYST